MSFKGNREFRQIHKAMQKAEVLGIYAAREIQKEAEISPQARMLEICVPGTPKNLTTMTWVNKIGYCAIDDLYVNDEILYEYVNFDQDASLEASQKIYAYENGTVQAVPSRIARLVFSMDAIVAEPQGRELNF